MSLNANHLVASRFGEIDNVQRTANDQRQLLNEARAQNVDQYRQLNWSSTFQNCASSDIFGHTYMQNNVMKQIMKWDGRNS
uniref:Uncharacterized protein n=1 Tax=Globodera rostochiensis TaxID=31243 RepID=A0A914I0L9_GLORO